MYIKKFLIMKKRKTSKKTKTNTKKLDIISKKWYNCNINRAMPYSETLTELGSVLPERRKGWNNGRQQCKGTSEFWHNISSWMDWIHQFTQFLPHAQWPSIDRADCSNHVSYSVFMAVLFKKWNRLMVYHFFYSPNGCSWCNNCWLARKLHKWPDVIWGFFVRNNQ